MIMKAKKYLHICKIKVSMSYIRFVAPMYLVAYRNYKTLVEPGIDLHASATRCMRFCTPLCIVNKI